MRVEETPRKCTAVSFDTRVGLGPTDVREERWVVTFS